ncbi:UTRA domain-containing protein [Sodalis sp. RH21]|uniref:UTRA domain-containing protein n=1 Tax=unclassified Sodalis (in: enterobacteria) TaxID=2636512 RepID=UPI0039B45201
MNSSLTGPSSKRPPAEKRPSQATGKKNGAQEQKNLPIHLEIQRDIKNRIQSGEWKPGDRVPTEIALMEIYKCSRMTVNKAISSLVSAGFIIRKRRSGSFVASPRVDEPLVALQDIRAEVLATDRIYSFAILHREIRHLEDSIEAEHIGVPLNARMLCVEVMHYADNLPFALETRQINLSVVPEVADETFTDVPPGGWLLGRVPWTEGEHSLRAISADEELSNQLRIAAGTACISIARRTWLAGDLITFVRLIYPGERHRFVVRFGASPVSMSVQSRGEYRSG